MLFKKPIISICIPTYNREYKLKSLLDTLQMQISVSVFEQIQILVIDNASTDNTENVVKKFESLLKIKYIKNSYNVGLAGNLVKCFEHSTRSWLWILGDDDKLENNAVDTVMSAVLEYENVAFISFNSSINENHNTVYKDIVFNRNKKDFINNLKDFSNLLFISSNVYNLEKINPNLELANYTLHAQAPQLSILFDYINKENGVTIFHNKKIVNCNVGKPSWDYNYLAVNILFVVDILIISDQLKKKLVKDILRAHPIKTKASIKNLYCYFFFDPMVKINMLLSLHTYWQLKDISYLNLLKLFVTKIAISFRRNMNLEVRELRTPGRR